MLPAKRYPTVIWLCILLLIFPLGCAQSPKKIFQHDLGSIGIVHGNFTPEVMIDKPARGWLSGAGRGSAKWSGKILSLPFTSGGFHCSGEGCGLAVIVLLGLTVTAATIGGMAGGVVGAVTAEPAKKVDEAENIINGAIAKLKIQETFRDHVAKEAEKKVKGRCIVIEGYGPTSIDQKVYYGHLAARGIDTVIQVSVIWFGLIGKWELNPPLNLEMDVQVKVIQVKDEKELYSELFHYSGGQRLFSEWCVDSARPLHEEFERCYQTLADNITTALFL